MVALFPFKGVLPAKDKVSSVVSRPFDKYAPDEVEAEVRKNPDSFLNIIKPELADGKKTRPDNPEAQKKSREKFLSFVERGTLKRQTTEQFYIYRQVKTDFVYTGIIAAIDATAYRDGTIKIHEQTLSKKEEKLKDYLQVVGINAEPVMFTYQHRSSVDDMVRRLTENVPYADFNFDGKQHLFWVIDEPETVEEIKNKFREIGNVYVADGHHRSASSVLLAESMDDKSTPSSRFLGIFFPDHNLQLFEFNRLVKDSNGLSTEEMLSELSGDFIVEQIPGNIYKPRHLHEISMYREGNWYSLKLRPDRQNDQLSDKLDANLLSKHILDPVLGVKDLRNDPRVDFVSGIKGPEALRELVDSGKFAVAFGLFPVSFDQFFAFSDKGKIMPPKTTWFEPKLLNGLVIYDLEPKD